MTVIETFVPAKVNLTLHVTGRREDGYHLIDSLAVFADIGDRLVFTLPGAYRLTVSGPMARGVPADDDNLAIRAARMTGLRTDILLEKHLPHAAGLGGGSGDAAAALRVLSGFGGQPVPADAIALGADIPLCLHARAARVRGIGDRVTPVPGLPTLDAVLVNPNQPVPTAKVFARLQGRYGPPMPETIPPLRAPGDLVGWLRDMRNDLEPPATEFAPAIGQILDTLTRTPGCLLARMSGSGGTCFGIYNDAETAGAAAGRLRESFPHWWVAATRLNPPGRLGSALS
ncbi:MAG: 4-(cytidine 5'-diphospho)-2-C-methyl-D-erythritol kinase [Roseovarius sp.]